MHAGPGGGMTGFIDYRHQTRYRKITYYSSGNRSYMNEEAPPQLVLEPWTYTRIELVDEHYGWVYSIEENVTVDEVTVYEYSWVRNLTTGVVTETDPVPTFPTLEWFSWAAIDTDTATAEWTVEETSTTQYAEFIQFVPKAYYDSGGSFDVPDTTQIKTITMEEPYTVTDCYNDAMELLDSIPLSPLPSAATYRINDTDDQSYGWNESIIVEYTGYPVAPRISSTAGDPGAPSVGKWFPNDDTFAANLPLDTDNLVPLDNGFGGWGILVAKIRAQPNAEATCMITTEVNQAVPTTVYTPDDGNAWTEETPVCGTITSGKDVKIGPGDIATSWGRKEFYRFCQTGELLWPECCDA